MKYLWIPAIVTWVVLSTPGSIQAQETAQPATPPAPVAQPKTNREWKLLRAHARTAADFRALSGWCESQVDVCRKKQSDYEKDLSDYYAAGRFYNPAKNVPRQDERLKRQIETCQKQLRYWSGLAKTFSDKAQTLETQLAQK